jgi:hypothetical protein
LDTVFEVFLGRTLVNLIGFVWTLGKRPKSFTFYIIVIIVGNYKSSYQWCMCNYTSLTMTQCFSTLIAEASLLLLLPNQRESSNHFNSQGKHPMPPGTWAVGAAWLSLENTGHKWKISSWNLFVSNFQFLRGFHWVIVD